MIPRANIIAFHKDGTVRELAELMVTRGHSRIPIYGDSLDDILGIIHIIDLAKCLLKGEGDVKVEDVVNREVKFVSPHSIRSRVLLPLPFTPTIARWSPSSIAKDMPSSITRVPMRYAKLFVLMDIMFLPCCNLLGYYLP